MSCQLYGLRIWYRPFGTSGGFNVTTVQDVFGIADVFDLLREYRATATLVGRGFQLWAAPRDVRSMVV